MASSFCSHIQPCYPGHCLSYTDLCTCTNGFIGTSCLIFDAQYRPNILRYNATIKFDNFSTGETLYEYRSDRGYTNITWSNQPSFNNFDLQLDADFKYLEIFGAVPAFPNYVNNASFGIVEGRVQFTHIRSGSEVSNRKLVCQQATQRQPIQELRCQLNDYTVVDALSGDSFKFFFEARSGGFVELTRINDGSITGTEFYNGSLITGKVEFHFDFDVPVHCFDSSSCSDPPLVLLQDVTKNTVRPFWVGWSDRISSIYRYTFEVWKLQYNETTNKLHEPLITTTSNPVPLYIIQVLPGNISYPEFTPTEPGMYSCILEINDHANNSEYIRRVVLYDPLSEIEVNQSNAIVVTSANPLTNYQWITNYTLLSNYDVYLQWKNLFRNKQHEDEHYLAEIETFEPRLSDNIYRHNYKRILSRFDDNEGNRTKHAVDNINGIVKFQYNYEIVNRPSTIVPVSGWITLKPINDSTVISMVTGSIGDGDTQQIWIRAFDIFNASKTETVVVRYDKSEPVTFLSNVEFNVPSDESEFRSRFTLESEDLHSGVVNVDVSIVLNETGEVKLSKMFHVQNLTETECVAILDCYCIPMGKCFMRPIILEINNCDLALHLDRIKDGTYLLNVTSVNMATLQTSTILQVGDVQNFRGISKYPSPQLVSVMNKTNSQVTIQWVDTPTCYPKSNYVIILHHANNETEHFQVNKELNSFIVTGLAPGSAYKADLYTDYLFEGLLIQSPEPLTISFSTESYCSHLMPCYPGSCKADVDECICRNGFFGNSCLEFDNQYKPILMSGSAKIAYVNTTLSKEVFSYTTNATREGNITWTNQAEYNVINFNIEASFDGFGTFGLLQNYPSYISNVSFGVVEGGFEIYHLRDSTALSHSTIECTDATNDNPVQFLSCQAQYEDMMYFESGDIFQIVISVRSGGNRKLVNLANGNNEGTQYYTGISTKHLLEFRFDFDVPLHCSLTSSCEDSPLKLNQDVTKTSISPYWSAWTDVLSGVHRFSLEIWKLEYVESEDGFREPLKNASQNPVPLFIYETLAENTMFPQFVFTEPGLYSCILEVNDRANNSEYVRRIVLYDSTSDVSVNSSSGIIVSSALSETDYSWQTDFDPKDVTTLQMSWSYLFYNFFHTQEHLLSKVLDYEPRLSDGGRRQNYKRIRSHFDDLEGNRTINALPNVNGITRYYFARKVVSRQTPDVPETGWSLVTPISDNISLKIDALTLGDGSTLQIWVRAFDILNNSQWQSTLVHFDHSAPNIFVNQPQYNVNGEFSFTSRFTFVTQDLHSGCVNTSIKLVLKDTGDVRYETNNTVLNETQTDCSKSSDCYCVPMGLCFRRTQTFDVNTCLLGVPLKLIDQGKYTLEISSYNSATLLSQVSTEIDVNDIVGVNQYPGPLEVSFLNKTKTAVILKWTATPTCYHVARYVVYLYTPNNATRELEILPNITEVTIMDLLPGVTYSIEMFAVYQEFGNESNVIRSLDSFTVDFETSEADQTTESSGRNFVPIIFGSVVGFIVLVILVIICIVWFLKRRHRNLCVGPISEPDIVNDASKRPIMKQTSTLSRKLLNTRNVLSVPQTPSLEKADTNLKTNIFDINLPKGRAHTLPPLPPLSSVMKQNHK